MNRTRTLFNVIVAVTILAAVAIGAWFYFAPDKEAPGTSTVAGSAKKEREILYWTDPMIPGFKSDKPGKSPMNMDMVPVYDDAQGSADEAVTSDVPVVSVRPEIAQSLGVRTHTVTRSNQARRVAVTGYLFRDVRGFAVLVDLIDREASQVRTGLSAEVRVADVPDRSFHGVVENVESDVGIGARTLKARVRLNQANAALKPNMYAEVTILGVATEKSALFIPREALIRTGARNAVVLALGSGRFQPVDVTPGVESDDWIEIRHGIKEGDVVVTSGQFLIDSEASVRASFSRMQSEEPAAPGEIKTPVGAHTGH